MPRIWTKKDERQYENIKEQQLRRGASQKRAKEIAARTVNKRRRQEGRAVSPHPRGTGNPTLPLDERTRDELYHRAQELKIDGRSRMSKRELIAAIRRHS